MNEKQLLNEITYYSKLINHYQTTNPKQVYKCPSRTNQTPHYRNKLPNGDNKNKYVYIKASKENDSAEKSTKCTTNSKLTVMPEKSSKTVLLNPNFKQSVHINPHFIPRCTKTSNMVHINPKHFPREVIQANTVKEAKSDTIKSDSTNLLNTTASTSSNIVNTRTKLIKSDKVAPKTKYTNSLKPDVIHSKYKIIRKNDNKLANPIVNKKASLTSMPLSKYKLDRRVVVSRKRLSSVRLSSSIFKSRYVYTKKNNTSLIRINGKLFKKIDNSNIKLKTQSKQWLFKNNKIVTKSEAKQKLKLISISGQMYHMNTNRRTLKIITKDNGKQECNNTSSPKLDRQRKRIIVLQARQKSIGTLVNRMQKNNIPCLLYRRFGRCKGLQKGTCKKVHNPDQIALCQKFLQGACINENCLLSHKVSPEKMPTCKFYLEGTCTKENCPYLHVKINVNAEICKNFLEGFCRSGDKCVKRHQYLCPDFERNGTCKKLKCRFPHVRKTIANHKPSAVSKPGSSKRIVSIVNSESVSMEVSEATNRYYTDQKESKKLQNLVSIPTNSTVVDSNLIGRPKLGNLPSFIPFFSP